MSIKEVMNDAGFNYVVKQLEKTFQINYHSDTGDNIVDCDMIYTASKDMDKKEYAKMQKDIRSTVVKGQGFIVYAWNDESGYDYWTVQQEEDNYIQVTAKITDLTKVDIDKLVKAIHKVQDKLAHYSRY